MKLVAQSAADCPLVFSVTHNIVAHFSLMKERHLSRERKGLFFVIRDLGRDVNLSFQGECGHSPIGGVLVGHCSIDEHSQGGPADSASSHLISSSLPLLLLVFLLRRRLLLLFFRLS